MRKAYDALPAGGRLIVHDFVAADDKTGPRDAALWFLTCMFNCLDAVVLTSKLIETHAVDAGFGNPRSRDLIPSLTKVMVAHKP